MSSNRKDTLRVAIQIIGWGILFAIPLFIAPDKSHLTILRYLDYAFVPFGFMFVFYMNYFLLIDRYLIQKRNVGLMLLANFILIGITTVSLHIIHNTLFQPDNQDIPKGPQHIPLFFFFLRDLVSLSMTAGLAVAVKMTANWYNTEYDRKELEKAKSEAELSNLKSQLNPHFLFNTLNNIYSLVNIDTQRAQDAIHDLSHLLRYVLYENNNTLVPLDKEVNFIRSYIELMSMRLSTNFHSQIKLPSKNSVMIAPMLLITLIENAFKHGISNTKDCFINIELSIDDKKVIRFSVVNSNYSEHINDKSNGIGLDNMKKRLELLYPNSHTLRLEDLGQTFAAHLTINTDE